MILCVARKSSISYPAPSGDMETESPKDTQGSNGKGATLDAETSRTSGGQGLSLVKATGPAFHMICPESWR